MNTIDIDELLTPITGNNPSGNDISFDPVYDTVKEARRADDDYLSQGDWKTEIKIAEWGKVKQLTCEVLAKKSKDLQMACWLTEALTNLHGFSGAQDGLLLISRLITEFWDTLYPEKEDGDLELRIGRLTWLDTNLPLSLNKMPMTGPVGETKGYGWGRWKESRDVDNLARQSQQALNAALEEGKIDSERWESAVKQTPAAFYQTLLADTLALQSALDSLDRAIQDMFGDDAPSISQLTESIHNIVKLATKLAIDKGVGPNQGSTTEDGTTELTTLSADGEVISVVTTNAQAGPPKTREEALRRLNEVAEYFRQAEPHSPVAYLVDKASRWGSMRLDEWLREVVQDDGTRYRLRELLGYEEQ